VQNAAAIVRTPKSILVVVERREDASALISKAVGLARPLGAHLELFLCDSEQAYVLDHAYDREGVLAARAASVAAARLFLSDLRASAGANDADIAIDAQCESPLYESVVRKVLRSSPGLVIKSVASTGHREAGTPDPNDWQLMRTCPAPLMLSRSRAWRNPPRFAAAVDVSDSEPAELARSVAGAAVMLAQGFGAQLHVVYGETSSNPASTARLEKLRSLCSEAGVAADCTHVLGGQPEHSLARFLTEQGYDALILGALAHRSAGTTPVGTLTSTLLDALDCDFVLVKPPSYHSPIAESAE
jgi:universal stress protein E